MYLYLVDSNELTANQELINMGSSKDGKDGKDNDKTKEFTKDMTDKAKDGRHDASYNTLFQPEKKQKLNIDKNIPSKNEFLNPSLTHK